MLLPLKVFNTTMRGFRVELTEPPNGAYVCGDTVTGSVICEVNEPKNYTQIKVKLQGKATVHLTQNKGSGRSVQENYISSPVKVLWDKETNGLGGKFPPGPHRFPFSFPLSGANLPASFSGLYGKIKYTMEARIVKESFLSKDTVAMTTLNYVDAVRIDQPEFSQPVYGEISKTVCCLLCASSPIVMTAQMPRTGFCIGRDILPLEVSVENGSNRTIRCIRVSLERDIVYSANGERYIDRTQTQLVASQPIRPHNSMVFRPDNVVVPVTVPSLRKCGILSVNYSIVVTAVINWSINANIKIPVLLGNVVQ